MSTAVGSAIEPFSEIGSVGVTSTAKAPALKSAEARKEASKAADKLMEKHSRWGSLSVRQPANSAVGCKSCRLLTEAGDALIEHPYFSSFILHPSSFDTSDCGRWAGSI